MLTDLYELLNTDHSFYDRKIANGNMTRKSGIVGNDHMIADQTIMCHMYVCHEQTIVSNYRFHSISRSSMNCYIFADDRIVADFCRCIFSFVFQILRRRTDDRPRKYLHVVSDTRSWINDRV